MYFSLGADIGLFSVQLWLEPLCSLTPEILSEMQEYSEINIDNKNSGAGWRMRENGHELMQERFCLGIKRKFLPTRTVKQ